MKICLSFWNSKPVPRFIYTGRTVDPLHLRINWNHYNEVLRKTNSNEVFEWNSDLYQLGLHLHFDHSWGLGIRQEHPVGSARNRESKQNRQEGIQTHSQARHISTTWYQRWIPFRDFLDWCQIRICRQIESAFHCLRLGHL